MKARVHLWKTTLKKMTLSNWKILHSILSFTNLFTHSYTRLCTHAHTHTLTHSHSPYSSCTHLSHTSHTPRTPGWPEPPQVRLLCWQRGILPLCTSGWQDKSLCKFNYVEEKQIWLTQLSAYGNYCECSYKISLMGGLTLLW